MTVKYKPGVKVTVADALSRVYLSTTEQTKIHQEHEVSFVEGINCPIDKMRIKTTAGADDTQVLLRNMVFRRLPDYRKQCPAELWEYWNFRCDSVIDDRLVLKGDRIIIPQALRKEVLNAILTGHQGETKCLLLARESVFWPGITNDIKNSAGMSSVCKTSTRTTQIADNAA